MGLWWVLACCSEVSSTWVLAGIAAWAEHCKCLEIIILLAAFCCCSCCCCWWWWWWWEAPEVEPTPSLLLLLLLPQLKATLRAHIGLACNISICLFPPSLFLPACKSYVFGCVCLAPWEKFWSFLAKCFATHQAFRVLLPNCNRHFCSQLPSFKRCRPQIPHRGAWLQKRKVYQRDGAATRAW